MPRVAVPLNIEMNNAIKRKMNENGRTSKADMCCDLIRAQLIAEGSIKPSLKDKARGLV